MRLSERLPDAVILKYYLYMATASAGLSIPIWVVFLRSHGLSYTEIMVLDAIWSVGIVAGEIPTGFVGDRIGWRNSLVVGNAIKVVAVVGMGLSSTFAALAGVYLFWALGSTLQSGTRDAWLYELLDRRYDAESFTRIRGRGQALTLLVSAGGAVVGGYLGAVDLKIPFFATGAVWLVGVAVLVTFPVIAVEPEDRITVVEALPTIRGRLSRPPLRSFVLWVAVALAAFRAVQRFTQPVSLALGVDVGQLGWLYAAFTLLAAAASFRADAIRERVGRDRWILGAPAMTGLLFVGVLVAPLVAFPAFFAVRAVRSATQPMADHYVNDHIETAGRATVLSAASMVYSLVAIPVRVGAGVLADAGLPLGVGEAAGPLAAMGIVGAVLAALAALYWVVRRPALGADARPAPDGD